MIVIEIHNSREVARRESRFARTFGGLLRGFVHERVERQVAAEIRSQLAARGIEAAVDVLLTED